MKNDLIVKQNEVISASYRLSLVEQRVLLTALAKIPKQTEVSDDEIYTVSVDDLKGLGVHEKTAYRDLKQAVERLYERSVSLVTKDGEIEKGSKMRWVQEINYSSDTGVIGFRFSKPILPYISNVKGNFTQYALSEVVNMQSVFSVRLYELCKQYLTAGKRRIDIDTLRLLLDLGSKYKTTGHLMDKVVNLAVKEINELTSLKVSAVPVRTGRKYTHIDFTIKSKPKPKQDKDRDQNTPDMFSGLTEKQSFILAKMIAELPQVGSSAPTGMSMKDFIEVVKQDLQKGADSKYMKYAKDTSFKTI